MRESLQLLYPNRFCIPSETDKKQHISKLFQCLKKRDNNNDTDKIDCDDNDCTESTIGSDQQKSWEAILED